jgi:hypothetical protein
MRNGPARRSSDSVSFNHHYPFAGAKGQALALAAVRHGSTEATYQASALVQASQPAAA